MKTAVKILLSVQLILSAFITTAQVKLDTTNSAAPGNPMVVKPEKPNDEMVIQVPVPNHGMAVLTDTGFINKNIMDNIMEIQLSKLGRDTATSPEVKRIARVMMNDHAAILLGLQKVARKRGMPHQHSMHKMPSLPPLKIQKGSDFNATWASAMLTMHDAKIAELEKFLPVTQDADLKAAISKALPKITMHKEMLLKVPGAKLTEGPNTAIH